MVVTRTIMVAAAKTEAATAAEVFTGAAAEGAGATKGSASSSSVQLHLLCMQNHCTPPPIPLSSKSTQAQMAEKLPPVSHSE